MWRGRGGTHGGRVSMMATGAVVGGVTGVLSDLNAGVGVGFGFGIGVGIGIGVAFL